MTSSASVSGVQPTSPDTSDQLDRLGHALALAQTQRRVTRTQQRGNVSLLLADLRDIARPRAAGDSGHSALVGYAAWNGATGDYILAVSTGYGTGSETIGGPVGALDMLRALERHGYRAGDWWEQRSESGYELGCELFGRDWSRA